MKPILKWIIGIFGGLLLLTVALSWYAGRQLNPLLDQQLKEILISSTDSLYRVEYEDLSLNVLAGSAKIKQLKLIADSAVYRKLELAQKAPDNRFDVEVAVLKINGLNLVKLIWQKELDVRTIYVDTPSVVMTNTYHLYNDTISPEKEVKELFLGNLKKISVEEVGLVGVNFTYNRITNSGIKRNAFKNVKIKLEDVLIDSMSRYDAERFLFTKAINVDMGPYKWELPDSYYYLSLDSLYLRTGDRKLVIEGLKYAPRVKKQQFYQELGYAKDMLDIWFEELTIADMDLARMMRSQRIRAGKLFITKGKIDVSNDLRYPRRPVNKIGKSPHQQLLKLDFPLKIDSVYVNQTDVSYAEMSGKYHKEGKITFQRTNGWLANVTNDSISLRSNQLMTADLNSYIMNEGKLRAQFTFDMLDKQGAFTYKGTVGPMNGKHFNRILTPLLSVEIESARIKGIRFDMQGNDYRNWGNFWFDYEDMKIGVLHTDSDGSTSKKKLVSFIANEMLLNTANPSDKGVYLIGKVNYQRPHEYSFFKTLWKSLFEGIKQTAGISREREARLLNTAETAVTIKEKAGTVINSIFKKRDRSNDPKNEEKKN